MSEQTTADRVRTIIIEHLGAEPEKVTPEISLCPPPGALTRFFDTGGGVRDLGADSLDVVELVMAFEEEFRIEIPDDEAEPLNHGTVQDCYDLVSRKLA